MSTLARGSAWCLISKLSVNTFRNVYRVPLPTQLYFFLSVFKTNNNLKDSVANYHLHTFGLSIFHPVSCAHARGLAFEYKSAFFHSARAHADIFSKTCTQLNSWKIGQ